MEIRLLRPDDDRSQFESGDPDLDGFLRRYAGQNQFRHHIGTTYVAIASGHILGYATIAPGSLEIDEAPPAVRKGLPAYPLPILRLARLATDKSARGQGIGRALLRTVFKLALSMARDFGCAGVVVDSKKDSVRFYEGLGFVRIDVVEGALESRPRPVAMFIPIQDIEAAKRT
jgi:GNAT superfamily N-acetyltransferase